jgi:hypothetical protein
MFARVPPALEALLVRSSRPRVIVMVLMVGLVAVGTLRSLLMMTMLVVTPPVGFGLAVRAPRSATTGSTTTGTGWLIVWILLVMLVVV